MAIKRIYLAPMLLTVVAAASIAAAPSALVEVACPSLSDNSTACETPGNAQMTSSPPAQTLPQPESYYGANGHGAASPPAGPSATFHHEGHRG